MIEFTYTRATDVVGAVRGIAAVSSANPQATWTRRGVPSSRSAPPAAPTSAATSASHSCVMGSGA